MRKSKKQNFIKDLRKRRARAKIFGTKSQPRLSIFRSNKYTSAQLIDDSAGNTLAATNTKELPEKGNKTQQALMLGKKIAEKAKKAGIKTVVFDRGAYKYHGRVKAVAEGAREGGLKF